MEELARIIGDHLALWIIIGFEMTVKHECLKNERYFSFPCIWAHEDYFLPCFAMQTNGRRDFGLGDELRVECSSFSSKGIAIVSLVDDQ